MCGILRLAIAAAIGGIILTSVACGENPLEAAADAVRIVPDGTSFSLEADGAPAVVPVAVHNMGDEPVYLDRCGPRLMLWVDRWTGERWANYAGRGCPAVYASTPLELRSGEIRRDTVALSESGHFRVGLSIAVSPDARPGAAATSRTFRVLPPGGGTATRFGAVTAR